MVEPYNKTGEGNGRVFRTPLVVPLSVIMVVAIYAGYIYIYATSEGAGFFGYLESIAFEVFLLCEVGMVSLILYNKRQLDDFLREVPVIESRKCLERLKPIVRTNMYSSLFMIVFLALGSLTAIMSILNHVAWKVILVATLSVATARLINWYNPSEEKAKQIECADENLEGELNSVLQCWVHKVLPNF